MNIWEAMSIGALASLDGLLMLAFAGFMIFAVGFLAKEAINGDPFSIAILIVLLAPLFGGAAGALAWSLGWLS